MELKLNLSDAIKKFRLFEVSDEILTKYGELNQYTFKSLKSRYPELYNLIENLGRDDIDEYVSSLIYNQKGSYRSIDLLSKILGISIYLYDENDNLLNNPEFDPSKIDETPVKITKVIVGDISLDQYQGIQNSLIPAIRDLVWLLMDGVSPDIINVEAEFNIHQGGVGFCNITLINNIVINEVEDEDNT